MKYIAPAVIADIREQFLSRIEEADSARIFHGSETTDLPVYKTRNGKGKIEVALKIPTDISTVTKMQVFDQDGSLLIERTDILEKPSTRAVYTKFEFDVMEGIL